MGWFIQIIPTFPGLPDFGLLLSPVDTRVSRNQLKAKQTAIPTMYRPMGGAPFFAHLHCQVLQCGLKDL